MIFILTLKLQCRSLFQYPPPYHGAISGHSSISKAAPVFPAFLCSNILISNMGVMSGSG